VKSRVEFSVGMLRTLLVVALAIGSHAAWGKNNKDRELDEAEHMEHEEYKAAGRAMGARDFEMDNMRRHKAGEINAAEMGMDNLKQAMQDPSAMAEMAKLMQDPDAMRQVKEMMANPEFRKQAQAVKDQMGDMPDLQKMMQDPAVMQKAQAMAQQMMGGSGGAEAELARLRAENAALRQQVGV